MAAVLVFAVLAAIIYGFKLTSRIDGVQAVAMIMVSLYNMLILSSLLGYGLATLPVYLWKCQDHKQTLYSLLERASTVREEYRASLVEFYLIVS